MNTYKEKQANQLFDKIDMNSSYFDNFEELSNNYGLPDGFYYKVVEILRTKYRVLIKQIDDEKATYSYVILIENSPEQRPTAIMYNSTDDITPIRGHNNYSAITAGLIAIDQIPKTVFEKDISQMLTF